ncbi:transposable element Tcb2 transposase [Trichonephila clavipes]|nr:transposable element Tcb2 transposase [Trichonephila clavipes]
MTTGIWQLLPKETDGASIRPVSSALFSYRFSLQSDSRRTLMWRVPGTRYQQENTIEQHRYGGAGWVIWGGIILGSRTYLHVQSVTMTGHIYRDVILEQHVRWFRGAMGAEFLFMDDSARPHRANIVDECHQSEDITRMDWPAYSPDLNPIEEIGSRVGKNQTTVMRICDRSRSHPPQCTTSREDRRIVCMTVTDCSVTSRTVAQHFEFVTHHSVSARTIRRRLQQNSLSA